MSKSKRQAKRGQKHDLADVLGSVRNGAADVLARAKTGVRGARQQVVRKAGEAASALSEEATRMIEEQKGRASERLGGIAAAGHQTARVMRAAKMKAASSYVEKASEAVDDLTDYLEDGDVKRFASDSADLARRYPVVAAVGTLVAGLLIGRLIAAGRSPRRAVGVIASEIITAVTGLNGAHNGAEKGTAKNAHATNGRTVNGRAQHIGQ